MVEGGSGQPLRERSVRASQCRRLVTALALAAALVVLAGIVAPASPAGPACAEAILDDWTRGALDASYSADCYEAAIDALPEDLRAYTTAADDISRVAIDASRADAPTRQLASASASNESVRAFPVTVVFLAAIVTMLAASGVTASMIRRRRAR
jgi:hypothetical protein